MPITIAQENSTTFVRFQKRCTIEDLPEIIPVLGSALEQSPKLKFDFSNIESLDTAVVQFLMSAAASCSEFLSHEDPYLRSTFQRWGLASAIEKKQ